MAVNFKDLLENAELTEEVKSALQEAWEGKILKQEKNLLRNLEKSLHSDTNMTKVKS